MTISKTKPKLTDAERHKRFLDMAKEVGASDDHEDFDSAFKKVVDPAPQYRQESRRKAAKR